jgi:hypothetical protein
LHPGPHENIANNLLADLRESSEPSECNGDRRTWCEQQIEVHAHAIEAFAPSLSAAERIRAALLTVQGKAEEAERLLASRCGVVEDRVVCLQARTSAAAQTTSPPRLAAATKELLTVSCTSPSSCAETATWVGDLLSGRGEWGTAVTFFSRACRDDPTESRWLRLANAADQIGARGQAIEALERVAQMRGGADAELKHRIEEQRSKAMRSVMGAE